MFIEDPESFKTWLTFKLEPLCEADPAALAKYVYALVKKDKPIEELKASMVDQLEVFLQKETKGFVELLFKTLETGDFEVKAGGEEEVPDTVPAKQLPDDDLRKIISTRKPVSPPKQVVSDKKEVPKEQPPVKVPAPPREVITGPDPTPADSQPPVGPAVNTRKDVLPERYKRNEPFNNNSHLSDREERGRGPRGRLGRRGSSMSPPMERRRSRSYDRRRSRDRDRSRAWRNKSPPSRQRYDRRRSYSKSPVRRHSRSRSPPVKRGRYRNRSPPPRSPRSLHSRSRSRSLSRNSIDRLLSPSRRDSPGRRLGSGTLSGLLNIGLDKPFTTKRCRDFDEKGFCMRGDLCPFDHGTDPVVLEDIPNTIYNGSNPVPNQPLHHEPVSNMEYNPAAPNLEPRMWRRFYRPGAVGGRGGIMGGGLCPPGMEAQFPKRELISVVTANPTLQPRDPTSAPPFRPALNASREMLGGKRYEPYSRMGMLRRTGGQNTGPVPPSHTNCTLQLKKVPPQNNNISDLNQHFSKFGKIVNILVGFEGNAESALITFSSYAEAQNAYKSTEPILNNRFIKVFWHTPTPSPAASTEEKQENQGPVAVNRTNNPLSNTKVLNSIQPSNVPQHQDTRVTMSHNNISKTIYVASALKKENTITKILTRDDLVKKKPLDEEALKEVRKKIEAKKEKIKMNVELRKRKQTLLEKQLNQQKLLIEKLEAGNIKTEQKTTIMSTIKSLQESIEKLKKDLAQDVEATLSSIQTSKKPPNPALLLRKTKEETSMEDSTNVCLQTQRELLDAELDLLKQEQQGKEVVELKKKISDLKMKAFQLKLPIYKTTSPPFTTVRGRGSFKTRRGVGATVRGRGAARFTYNSLEFNVIDHRPRKLLVSGYEQDDKAAVLTHFNQFGEILNYTSDDATPSLVINYKSRKEAEAAIAKGKNFQDRLLSVTWATPNHNIRPGITTQNTTTTGMTEEDELNEDVLISAGEDDEIGGLVSPSESLILQDEEEEDEEDRTWRHR